MLSYVIILKIMFLVIFFFVAFLSWSCTSYHMFLSIIFKINLLNKIYSSSLSLCNLSLPIYMLFITCSSLSLFFTHAFFLRRVLHHLLHHHIAFIMSQLLIIFSSMSYFFIIFFIVFFLFFSYDRFCWTKRIVCILISLKTWSLLIRYWFSYRAIYAIDVPWHIYTYTSLYPPHPLLLSPPLHSILFLPSDSPASLHRLSSGIFSSLHIFLFPPFLSFFVFSCLSMWVSLSLFISLSCTVTRSFVTCWLT